MTTPPPTPQPEPMTCREAVEFLMAYLDGELPADQRGTFDAHLAVCRSCATYLENYRATIRLGREAMKATDEPAAGRMPEALVRAIHAARRGQERGSDERGG